MGLTFFKVYFIDYAISVFPIFPLQPVPPTPPAFPPLSSCPRVVHISSLSSVFPIPFFFYFMPTNYTSSSLCIPPLSFLPPPHWNLSIFLTKKEKQWKQKLSKQLEQEQNQRNGQNQGLTVLFFKSSHKGNNDFRISFWVFFKLEVNVKSKLVTFIFSSLYNPESWLSLDNVFKYKHDLLGSYWERNGR